MPDSDALSTGFTHVVFKRLSAVEADTGRSNQHEFNAPRALKDAFGPDQPRRIETDFVWMPDNGEFLSVEGELTWYDSRARHPTRSEYRLYYRDNPVTLRSSPGDLLLIAIRDSGRVLLVIAPGTGLAAARLSWLFGIETMPGSSFAALDLNDEARLDLRSRLGVVAPADDSGWEKQHVMTSGTSADEVRTATLIAQRAISSAKAIDAAWEEVSFELPGKVPREIGGEGFLKTVRGVVLRSR